MGAIRFSVDKRLLRELTKLLPLKVFVETGTYKGDSVREAQPFFDEIQSVERSEQLYAGAKEALGDAAGVHLHHGRSDEFLRELAPRLKRKAVLYWLDAHWCEGEGAESADCALLQELDAIGKLKRNDVVLIDDARLFLAPPPPPANPDGWPDLDAVLEALSARSSAHELIVIDDVFVFAPRKVQEPLREFARTNAVDMVAELHNARHVSDHLGRLEGLVRALPSRVPEEGEKGQPDLGRRLGNLTRTLRSVGDALDAQGVENQTRLEQLDAALLQMRRDFRESKGEDHGMLAELRGGIEALRAISGEQRAYDHARLEELSGAIQELRSQLETRDDRDQDRLGDLAGGLGAVRAQMDELMQQSLAQQQAVGQLPDELEPLKLRLEVMREQVEATTDTLGKIERGLQVDGDNGRRDGVGGQLEGLTEDLETIRRQVSFLATRKRKRHQLNRRLKRILLAPLAILAWPFRKLGELTVFKRLRVRAGVYLRRLRPTPKLGRLHHHPPMEMQVPKRYRRPVQLADPPTISMVTPSYNQGQFIEHTLRSVLEQNYPRLEYVVQDGGSTDATREIIERYGPELSRWELREDDGHPHAINLGFEGTKGEIMAWINSDDILLPGALAYVARYFERHPKVDAIYGHRVLIDDEGDEIGRWVMPRHRNGILSWADYVPQETLFWRRELWERIGGGVDQGWPFAFDWDFLIRFVEAEARIVRVPRFLGGFRIHPEQKTLAIADTQGAEEMRRMRIRMLGHEPSREEIRDALRWYLRRHIVLHKLYRAHLLRY